MTHIFDHPISKQYSQRDVDNWFTMVANHPEHEVFEAFLANELDTLSLRMNNSDVVVKQEMRNHLVSQFAAVKQIYDKILKAKGKRVGQK